MSSTIIKNKQVTIPGPAGKIFIDDGGESGTPVLFVHSFGGSTGHWQYQLEPLRKTRRAIAMDMRGHGRSTAPADNNYAVPLLADDIAAVARDLGLDRFILVGHSMGGSAAIAYAGKYPDRVAGLFISGTPGKTPAEQSAPVIASLESDKYEAVMKDYMKRLLQDATAETEKMETEGMDKLSKETSINIIKAVFAYDPLPDMRNYPGPKMIVSKTEDDEQPNSLHKTFPAIPYMSIEGTSHWIQLDKPGEFNAILFEFISMVEAAAKKPV